MAKRKQFTKLKCSVCKRINYHTKKSRMLKAGPTGAKLELKKFCEWCRRHTVHKEVKK